MTETNEVVKKDKATFQSVVAVSKEFGKIFPKWTQEQIKMFFAILERINWRIDQNPNVITIDNKDLMRIVGWDLKSGDDRLFAFYVRKTMKDMMSKSLVKMKDYYHNGSFLLAYLIYDVSGNADHTTVILNSRFMPHFENLVKAKSFYAYWLDDVYKLDSKHGCYLYIELINRAKHRPGETEEVVSLSTMQLKTLFGLDKEAYMRKNGTFDRSNFEQKVLVTALNEVNNSCLVSIIPNEDGSLFEKEKINPKKVGKYTIRYKINSEILKSGGLYEYNKEAFSNLVGKRLECEATEDQYIKDPEEEDVLPFSSSFLGKTAE